MGLDIRLPLGLIFAITGAIMALYGLFTRNSEMYAQSGGLNINLIWGAVMFVFGAIMLLLSRRAPRPEMHGSAPANPEAQPRRGGH